MRSQPCFSASLFGDLTTTIALCIISPSPSADLASPASVYVH
jgi:hypothetical protein